ncbi:hypothetical protein JCM10212_004056 [Sporobolomyces blumeae]
MSSLADDRPVLALVLLSGAIRTATTLILVAAHAVLPSFDASAAVLDQPIARRDEAFVRWDTVHFIAIANEGYALEQRLAFTPGLPGLMRGGGRMIAWIRGAAKVTQEDMVLAGILGSAVATAGAAVLLFKLSLRHFGSRKFAMTSATLFLLAPARAVLHAVPYTEPFAAFCAFAGMLAFSERRHLVAALAWSIGSLFRAQGAALGLGFFGWRFMLEGGWQNGQFSAQRFSVGTIRTAFFAAMAALPLLAFQAFAHRQFCSPSSTPRPWCSSTFGFSYGWVQSHYWDNGFLRYWTFLQIPNFLLAAPVLALSFAASYSYYTSLPRQTLSRTLPFLPSSFLPSDSSSSNTGRNSQRRFLSLSLIPYVHLHTATTLLLFLSSHIQIILRLCIVNPVVWWYAADLVLSSTSHAGDEACAARRKRWGSRWVTYCVVWGTIATILWALFLPPA